MFTSRGETMCQYIGGIIYYLFVLFYCLHYQSALALFISPPHIPMIHGDGQNKIKGQSHKTSLFKDWKITYFTLGIVTILLEQVNHSVVQIILNQTRKKLHSLFIYQTLNDLFIV